MLNRESDVIGVSVATFRGGQNLNFAIPSNYLRELVAKVGPVKPLSKTRIVTAKRSILADLGGKSTEGVTAGKLIWTYPSLEAGDYSFSLRSRLRENVKNVSCLVIFYDAQGDPIDVDVVQFQGLILAGLAKRVASSVHGSVQGLTTRPFSKTPHTKVEIRILGFEIME